MSKVNIGGRGRDANDPHFRYKRDVLEIAAVNKKHWKIKNIDAVARQLKVRKEFVDLFYQRIKKKGHPMIGSGVFRGDTTVAALETILIELIDELLLCPKCKLPEWRDGVCKACGQLKTLKIKPTKSPEERRCSHVSEAVAAVRVLYNDRPLATGEKLDLIEKLLDCFWKIPTCEVPFSGSNFIDDFGVNEGCFSRPKVISEEDCAARHEKFCGIYRQKYIKELSL